MSLTREQAARELVRIFDLGVFLEEKVPGVPMPISVVHEAWLCPYDHRHADEAGGIECVLAAAGGETVEQARFWENPVGRWRRLLRRWCWKHPSNPRVVVMWDPGPPGLGV